MSCGIAHAGMQWAKQEKPTPLPVQALDHATGYLMAASVLKLITEAVSKNKIGSAKLSLARTAELLISNPQRGAGKLSIEAEGKHVSAIEEITPWGRASRLLPALTVQGVPMQWSSTASELGSSAAVWNQS